MSAFEQWWLEGGVWMYFVVAATVLYGMACLTVAVVAITAWFVPILRMAALVLGVLGTLGGLLPALVGAGGLASGRANVDEAVKHADPSYADEIREVGYREAQRPLELGLVLTPVTVLGGVACLAIAVAARRRT